MLTTVLTPSSGEALINEYSILKAKKDIIKIIGVCPQEIIIYDVLRAEENVEFVAQMHGMSRIVAKEKAKIILEKFGIAGRKEWSKNFSGGMKRRLNLAMALVFDPIILFLDEPTAGLDPQARRVVWDFIGELKKTNNITIVLTTHDMNEAEVLSDRIAIIDKGKIIAEGTPNELKDEYGKANILQITFFDPEDLEKAKKSLADISFISNNKDAKDDNKTLYLSFEGGIKNLVKILQQGIIDNVGEVENIKFRQTTLEDVFLNLTGKRLRD